jgi:hypothetical protein
MCYRKQQRLSERLKRKITMEEVHTLCDELGFTDPEDTMRFIETAPIWEIEGLISKAKKKKKKKVGEAEHEYEYIYAK